MGLCIRHSLDVMVLDGILGVENFDTSLAEGVMLLTPFAADAQDDKTTDICKSI